MDKIYKRLDELQGAFVREIIKELRGVLDGSLANYLGRRLREDWDTYSCNHLDGKQLELEDLESEIRSLRAKLREPLPGEVLSPIEAFVRELTERKEPHPATDKKLVGEVLVMYEKLGS